MRIREAIAMLAEFGKVAGEDCEVEIQSFRLEGTIHEKYERGYDYTYPSSHKPGRNPAYVVVPVIPAPIQPQYQSNQWPQQFPTTEKQP